MKVLEIMERTGIKNPSRCIAYIIDALNEIQAIAPDKIERITIDVEADTRYYSIPTMVDLRGVWQKGNTESTPIQYVECARIAMNKILEDAGASSASILDDLIVI